MHTFILTKLNSQNFLSLSNRNIIAALKHTNTLQLVQNQTHKKTYDFYPCTQHIHKLEKLYLELSFLFYIFLYFFCFFFSFLCCHILLRSLRFVSFLLCYIFASPFSFFLCFRFLSLIQQTKKTQKKLSYFYPCTQHTGTREWRNSNRLFLFHFFISFCLFSLFFLCLLFPVPIFVCVCVCVCVCVGVCVPSVSITGGRYFGFVERCVYVYQL